MPLFLVERDFPEPVASSSFESIDGRTRFCFDTWRVRPLRTYVSRDGHRVLCLVEAPDREGVAQGNASAGLPVSRIHPVTLHPAEAEDLKASSPRT